MRLVPIPFLAILLASLLLAGCGGASAGSPPPAGTPIGDGANESPRIERTVPVHQAYDVDVDRLVEVFFEDGVRPSSVNGKSIVVETAEGRVDGEASYDAARNCIVFTPDVSLAVGKENIVTVKRGIEDLAGNERAEDFVFRFRVEAGQFQGATNVEPFTERTFLRDMKTASDGNGFLCYLVWETNGEQSLRIRRVLPDGTVTSDWSLVRGVNLGFDRARGMAIAESGDAIVTWSEDRGADRHAYARYYDAQTLAWTPKIALETARTYDAGVPQAVLDDAGHAVVAWKRLPAEFDGDMRVAQYSFSQGLSPVRTLSSNVIPASPTALRGTSNGRAILTYTVRSDDGEYNVAAALYNPFGGGWADPKTVDAYDDGNCYRPNGFIDRAGHAVVAWEQQVVGNAIGTTYWGARFRPGQGFDTPLQLDGEGRPNRKVAAHIDGDGNGHLVFVRDRDEQGAVIAYPWRQDAGWQASVDLHEGNPDDLLFTSLQVCGSEDGPLYVFWVQGGFGANPDGRWVTAAIRDPATGTWNTPIAMGDTNEGAQARMEAALDPTGGCTVAWLTRVVQGDDVKHEVRTRHIDATGHRGFSDLLNAGANRFASDLELVVGPTGRGVAGWTAYTQALAESDVMVSHQD